jgi:1,4-alpha-glucan branching enzyme
MSTQAAFRVPPEIEALAEGRHGDPFTVLGPHDTAAGPVVRVFLPGARAVEVLRRTDRRSIGQLKPARPDGIFEGPVSEHAPYLLRITWPCAVQETEDPYSFGPLLGELDLHLFNEGRHFELAQSFGAQAMTFEGVQGVGFSVWAPNARRVAVVGDFNAWDSRRHPMRLRYPAGVWEIFVPRVVPGARYKFDLIGPGGGPLPQKADPLAKQSEAPPATASVVASPAEWKWHDDDWMKGRARRQAPDAPMSTYEVHLGSWMRPGKTLQWDEAADRLIPYLVDMGFTHLELLPITEHPFGGSWGYQPLGLFSPTGRYGTPEGFKRFVDRLHGAGIGLILDWVPGHFPTDAHGLARFDGTALYEHAGPMGSHPDWGTLVFNLGRHEIRNFLIANALFWINQYHIDALRVDAVASMLYLNYSRQPGQWVPNEFGGNENLEAVSFLKELNETIFSTCPGATTIAEESTAWPGVSRPTYLGGLGFGFKWNLGWMHDTLNYFETDPLYRRFHQNDLTFGLLYAWHENFILPLSHDEVVHGKRSMLAKMSGDRWRQLANLRALYAWMWAHPGKKLIFMGDELGEEREWDNDRPLDWWMLDQWPDHAKLQHMVAEINRLYRAQPAFWEQDYNPAGFRWIDASDADHNVLAFWRSRKHRDGGSSDGPSPAHSEANVSWPNVPASDLVVCVANFSPVPQVGYRIGLPRPGRWLELLNTDAEEWGGSGLGNMGEVLAEDVGWHGLGHSTELVLPPLGVLWLAPAPVG